MKKNGFTLVELLAVIVILGLLLTIIVPNLLNVMDNNKQKLYDNQIKELERLTQQYLLDNLNLQEEIDRTGSLSVNISVLCSNGYINCPVKNPKTNQNIEGCINITQVNDSKTYTFGSC